MESPKNKEFDDIKSDFITIASHQLRTPIAAIRWSLDTLLRSRAGTLTDKQQEILREAYQNNRFLVKVVNDLLRAARIEQRGGTLTPKTIALQPILREIVRRVKDFADAFNCQITLKIDPSLQRVYIDTIQIQPILEGLLDNAIRYSQQAGKIIISAKNTNGYVLVSIKDNGIGIPSDQQDKIFGRFFRARNAIKSQTEGLGLDLYISRIITEQSAGRLTFKSAEGKGSVFQLYLPTKVTFQKIAPPQTTKDAEPISDPENILKKEREFVSITVHELKAPLGMAKWSLEMLADQKVGKLNNDQKELIEQLQRGNERLLVLVRDLLDLAKLQEGQFTVEPKPMKLELVIKDAFAGFALQAKQKKLRLETTYRVKPIPKIIGDPIRIAQAVTNLISNGVKYTPNGGAMTVEISKMNSAQLRPIDRELPPANLVNTGNEKGYVVVAVKDTGIGIPAAEQEKMFTRFFRSKNVLQSKAEGTGLGLYITKSIVNLHRGDVWFMSLEGQGSTFFISLPIT